MFLVARHANAEPPLAKSRRPQESGQPTQGETVRSSRLARRCEKRLLSSCDTSPYSFKLGDHSQQRKSPLDGSGDMFPLRARIHPVFLPRTLHCLVETPVTSAK